MKTAELESKKGANNAVVNKAANPVTEENKNPQFVAGNPVNKDSAKPAETEKPKEEVKASTAPVAEQPQAEHFKPELKAEPVKPVRNLTETIKVLEELHRLTLQRNKLLATIDNLESFEVGLKEDFDETEGNYYTGCILTIEDDTRKKFTTKNPLIIWTVAQQINSICVAKLGEVEAKIVITA
ncbi:hypothetical protein BDD43_3559 [Mucilaginibacter gracilis]|uniref:Uncharacterized protein n=1 Tax=Mucilaginibacter gracilis TaxID=423350 RepID=A0A495J3F0_9SPHI|nr:hypothetical protein [Mucilaginibacter gracilis]RKR83353.1 hypothetical protein BDD43_3559 [Mucilaginibacter gracilis]